MLPILETTSFDADEPEASPKNRQIKLRDVIIISIVLVALAGIFTPLILDGIERRAKVVCFQNIKGIGEAMLLYSSDNNDRFPPTYNMESDRSPALFKGLPITWASQVQPLMSARQNFVCPSAKSNEGTNNTSLKVGEKSFVSTYGMYRGMSSVLRGDIPNPSEVVLVAETSNQGAEKSFDPIPFEGKPDGFLIGWDDSNFEFSKASRKVTRLAFRNTESGTWTSRHKTIVHALSAEANLITLTAADAEVLHAGNKLKGRWWADLNLFR